MLEIFTHSLFSHAARYDLFFVHINVNFMLNVDTAYNFVYSHKSWGMTGEHWLMVMLLYLLPLLTNFVDYMCIKNCFYK